MAAIGASERNVEGVARLGETPRQAWKWITSTRSRRVICLLLCVWIINGFDLVLTVLAQRTGMLHEENPIARAVLAHGEGAIFAFKVLLVVGASTVLLRCRRHRCSELAVLLVALTYSIVAVQWKLCYDMYELTLTHARMGHGDELAQIDIWLPAGGTF